VINSTPAKSKATRCSRDVLPWTSRYIKQER